MAWLISLISRDEVLIKLKKLHEPFGIKIFYTDDRGAYDRHLDDNKHVAEKKNTQKIERKNLNFRTWISVWSDRQQVFNNGGFFGFLAKAGVLRHGRWLRLRNKER